MPDDAFHILKHFNRRNPQSLISCRCQNAITCNVSGWPIAMAVIVTINLDQQPMREAGEVRHMAADRVLLPKFPAVGPGAKDSPE